MFYTRRSLKMVEAGCRSAQTVIRDEIAQAAVLEASGTAAWGQFLDAAQSATQVGVYGTSAAMAVLATAYDETHHLVQQGALSLPVSSDWTSQQAKRCVHDQHDLASVFKLSAVLEAYQTSHGSLGTIPQIGQDLIALKSVRGWPDFQGGPAPLLLPTVAALWALRRFDSWTLGADTVEPLEFVANEVRTSTQLGLGPLAFSLLVLETYFQHRGRPQDLRHAISVGGQRAKRLRETDQQLERSSYHYEYVEAGSVGQEYVFYPTRVLLAQFVLTSERPEHSELVWAVREVDRIQQQIVSSGHGLVASQRVNTVDQLWTYRLLGRTAELISTSPTLACPRPLKALSTTRRLLIAAVLLAVTAVASAYFAAATGGIAAALLFTVSAITASLAPTALWQMRDA